MTGYPEGKFEAIQPQIDALKERVAALEGLVRGPSGSVPCKRCALGDPPVLHLGEYRHLYEDAGMWVRCTRMEAGR